METTMTALEMTGTIDEHRQLQLDDMLPFPGPTRVRVIVLYPSGEEWDETEWLKAASRNPAFDFLNDPEEDIYSLEDGRPFYDEICELRVEKIQYIETIGSSMPHNKRLTLSKEELMNWEEQLIQVYCHVCDLYQRELWPYCERFSNNAYPDFTDEEVITIYLFGIMEKRFHVTQIHKHTQDHLFQWFPKLPSYGGYIQRLNALSAVFPPLLNALTPIWAGGSKAGLAFLLDSMPIILAPRQSSLSGKSRPRSG